VPPAGGCAGRLRFFGSGVSGGEVGARFGPPFPHGRRRPGRLGALAAPLGGHRGQGGPATGEPLEDYAPGRPVTGGEPCAADIGTDGAGHFVKMVHNGIEYIDMQLIAEAHELLGAVGGLGPEAQSRVFARWNRGDLRSCLWGVSDRWGEGKFRGQGLCPASVKRRPLSRAGGA
jgi:6-phosphogluconate dehydrogenase